MKYIVLIPDGSADRSREDLRGRTPLQAAETPNFDRLAAAGQCGLVRTVPDGFPAGSDVANLCVMGFDPHLYYTGRAPLEAASLGIDLGEGGIAFRCNLVFVEDGVMKDFSAGHISTEEAARLIADLHEGLGGPEVSFYPGLSYRHIMVSRGRGLKAACTPPHDITGQPVEGHLPGGEDAEWLRGLMDSSTRVLADHPVNRERVAAGKAPANMIWLWGQGTAPSMPRFQEKYGLTGAVISAVDLVKGLGAYAGLQVVEVPGATGWLDTDYAAKGHAALEQLEKRDFVYVHVEAPDEASHAGDTQAKLNAISRIDSDTLGTILAGLEGRQDYRILVLPDHATPLEIKTHSSDPVPFLFYDAAAPAATPAGTFDEASAAASGLEFADGWTLMDWFIRS